MTITEFIKEQAKERAEAAAKLSDELEINGIQIYAGCSKDGIQIYKIEKLAEILGCKIQLERCGENVVLCFFCYNGVKFYEHKYGADYERLLVKTNEEERENVPM